MHGLRAKGKKIMNGPMSLRNVLRLALCGGLLAGCGAAGPVGWDHDLGARMRTIDEKDEWLGHYGLDDEPEPGRRRSKRRSRARRADKPQKESKPAMESFGVRGGAMVPLDDEGRAPDSRPMLGVFVRLFQREKSTIEIAVDLTPEGDDVAQNFLAVLRGELLYVPFPFPVYVAGGVGIMREEFFGTSDWSPLIAAGVGMFGRLTGSMTWDARLSFQHLLDSQNVENLLILAAGVNF